MTMALHVSIVDAQGAGRAEPAAYEGGDYSAAFKKATELRQQVELRGKWIRFEQGSTVKWARIA